MTRRHPQAPARRGHRPFRAVAGVSALVVALVVGCAPRPAPPQRHPLGFPSPTAGPGSPELDRTGLQALDDGWRSLLEDRAAEATAAARTVGGRAGTLLELQAAGLADPAAVLDGLRDLTRSNAGYAAAWLTLSIFAERSGDEQAAWRAARRGAELWPTEPWSGRVRSLGERWIGDRVDAARDAVGSSPAEALETVRRALALDPDNPDGRLVEARALLGLDRLDEAEAAAVEVEDRPEAQLLLGEIAERRGDWLGAMSRYQEVPAGVPGRDRALLRAQLRWRLEVLPGWVREAADSPSLTRRQLAVLLVSLLPQLESLEGGPVPLMSDIVDLPGRGAIVTAVRLGLMSVDRLEHRFDPHRTVTPEQTRDAVDAAVARLGWSPVDWCDDVVSSGCSDIDAPVTGHAVTRVLLELAEGDRP